MQHSSVHLLGAVATVGVVGADIGRVRVGNAVAAVGGVVVGTANGSPAKDHIDRDEDNEEQHGADDDDRVECDADTGVALLRGSSGPQRHDGQDEGWDGAGEADERRAATEQRDDGEHESAHRHSRVVLLRRRLVSSRHRARLGRHHDGGVAGGDGWRRGHRLVARLSTIVVGGRLTLAVVARGRLRRKLGRSGLVSAFGVLLVGLWRGEGLLIRVRSSHRATNKHLGACRHVAVSELRRHRCTGFSLVYGVA